MNVEPLNPGMYIKTFAAFKFNKVKILCNQTLSTSKIKLFSRTPI